jgi:hypothetical protein
VCNPKRYVFVQGTTREEGLLGVRSKVYCGTLYSSREKRPLFTLFLGWFENLKFYSEKG